ncbi:MAG TPA: glycosyltransferase family protein [Kofleriaceae bacterium]|nr:glycosyltransferase family protein [Kofleriaceae bacterium]
MKVVVVIQARTGSTRLPGKVLLPAAGAPLLARMVERVRAARTPSHIVVATTTLAADDEVAALARAAGAMVVRGHPTDLLDRHVAAARATGAEAIAKIPSDCPLIDPAVIDRVIEAFASLSALDGVDYVSNLHPVTWPDGFDVEVMTRGALETAWREATRPLEREHTTPFLWDNPDRFVCHNVRWEGGADHAASCRLTLDYPEDYVVIRGIYDALWSPHRPFTLADIIELLAARPALRLANARHFGSSWYHHHPGELRTLAREGAP